MKKILIAIAAISLLAASCKKDTQTKRNQSTNNVDNAKKYKVTYTLDGFTQTTKTLSVRTSGLATKKTNATGADTLGQAVTQYYYIVYNSSGNEIKRIKRAYGQSIESYYHEDNGNYGLNVPGLEYRPTTDPYNVITDSLAAGTYTIVVAGSDDDMGINSHDTQWSDDDFVSYLPLGQAKVYQNQSLDISPISQVIYFGKTTITVAAGDSAQGFSLNRVVGQLEVNIEDAIPANVASISIAAIGNNAAFFFNNETSGESAAGAEDEETYNFINRPVTAGDIGTTNFKVTGYIMNTNTPITILVRAFDSSHSLITFKRIDNVQFSKNKRTILTGKLFAPITSPQQFNIFLNQTWNADVNVSF